MGHPNEEFVAAFFWRHKKDIEYYTPRALVRRALEEYNRWIAERKEGEP